MKRNYYLLQQVAHMGHCCMDVLLSSVFLWAVILTVMGTSPAAALPLPAGGIVSPTHAADLGQSESENSRPYIVDEGCHITVWDSTKLHRGVHQVNGRCREGLVSWRSPYGAVRLTLSANGYHANGLEACILAKSNFTTAKISLETHNQSPLETLVTLNNENPQTEQEICVRSKQQTISLYIEADQDLNSWTIGKVELEYSLDTLDKSTPSSHDPEEDCRPCTEKELLTAACTKDFVVSATMDSVYNNKKSEDTIIHLSVDNIYRQIEEHFTQVPKYSNQMQQNLPDSPAAWSSPKYSGAVVAPKNCGVIKGSGQFLFLGRFRLGKAIMQCAPRLEDFRRLWLKAVNSNTNPCTIKWNL